MEVNDGDIAAAVVVDVDAAVVVVVDDGCEYVAAELAAGRSQCNADVVDAVADERAAIILDLAWWWSVDQLTVRLG